MAASGKACFLMSEYGSLIEYSPWRDQCLTSASLGQIRADLAVLSRKTAWGIRTNRGRPQPSAIIYMYLDITQGERKFGLRNARIVVDFETPAYPRSGPFVSQCEPTSRLSEATTSQYKKTFAPNFSAQAAGFGASAKGISSEKQGEIESRWSFVVKRRTFKIPGESTRLYMKWEAEREYAGVPLQRPMHTAAVISHENRPFKMTAKIKLSPISMGQRIVEVFATRKPGGGIHNITPEASNRNLDDQIKGLRAEIDRENIFDTPGVYPEHQATAT